LNISGANSNVSVINNGSVSANQLRNNSLSHTSTWTNAANSNLTLKVASFTEANNSLVASASGNTVTFTGVSSYAITKPSGGVYYNLTCATSSGNTLSLAGATTVSNNLLISTGALDVSASNYALSVGGNFTNNSAAAAFVPRSGTVTLNGAAGQTIGGTFTTSFYNLTDSGNGSETVTLASNETITNNFTVVGGTFDCQTFQLTGNASGTLSLAAGSTLLLGTTASATNVAFPTNFTAGAHISLASTSTVKYLANTATQTISVSPTYGNLIIDAGSAVTKTPTGTPLTVAGNLTINSNATLSETINTVSVTGTSTINGGLTYTTGHYNATGAVTNAGTLSFTTGAGSLTTSLNNTGTVTFTGAGSMTIGTTFTNSGTYTSGTANLSVTGTSSITAGTVSFTTATYHATGAVTNAGTLSFTSGTGTLGASLNNTGTVTYTGAGTMSIGTTLTNSGTFTAGTATISVTGTSSLTAGTLSFTTGIYNATGLVTNAATLSFTSGTGNLLNGLTNSGTTTFTGAGILNIAGAGSALDNTGGTFNSGTGAVNMTGTTQTISGNAISFYDLGINQTSSAQTVTLNTSESFQDVLTMTTGTLAASGANTMTLLSNAARTARIAQVVTPANTSITAKFVIQRYFAGRASAAYAALSSPVQSAQTIKDWNNSNQTLPNKFYMSGVGGPNGTASSYVSVYLYKETNPHGSGGAGNFVKITSYATPGNAYMVTPGQGIYLWLGTSLSTMSNPFTYLTNGIPSIAPAAGISIGVTNSGAADGNGYNLLGNPFCSPIDWTTFQAANPSLGGTFGLRQEDGSWHYYAAGSIPMGQGFMVIASGAATINFKENQKTAIDASMLRPEKALVEVSDEPNAITFVLSNDSNNWSSPTTILFGNNYAKTYKFGNDMPFNSDITEGASKFYTASPDGYNLSVYSLPDNEAVQTVPLVAVAQVKANHTITVNGLDNISSYQCVNLIDQATGAVLNNFNTNPAYTFSVSELGDIRSFGLQFTKLNQEESCNESISDNNLSGDINITPSEQGARVSFNLPQESNAVISIYNILGQKVMNDVNTTAYNNQLIVNLTQGHLYIIKVQTVNGIFTKKLYR